MISELKRLIEHLKTVEVVVSEDDDYTIGSEGWSSPSFQVSSYKGDITKNIPYEVVVIYNNEDWDDDEFSINVVISIDDVEIVNICSLGASSFKDMYDKAVKQLEDIYNVLMRMV